MTFYRTTRMFSIELYCPLSTTRTHSASDTAFSIFRTKCFTFDFFDTSVSGGSFFRFPCRRSNNCRGTYPKW